MSERRLVILLVLGACVAACRTARPPVVEPIPGQSPSPSAPGQTGGEEEEEYLPVKKVQEEIIVAAWAEPKALPDGGGQAQLLVRVQKKGGAPFPGVEVRFRTSVGTLFSGGRVLVTDKQGHTRDRLTTKKTATLTLNAGGTRYRFQVPVGEEPPP